MADAMTRRRENVEAVSADLLAVWHKHVSTVDVMDLVDAFVGTTGSLLSGVVDAAPIAAPHIDTRLGELMLFVASTTSAKQAQ